MLAALLGLLCVAAGMPGLAAQTLRETLRAANVPTDSFAGAELDQKISSSAHSGGEPFLMAYYLDSRAEPGERPLHVIRYVRGTGSLRGAELRDIHAISPDNASMNCLYPVAGIRESRGTIYVETHISPSAGCVLVISSDLSFQTALPGWLLGIAGGDYAIVRRSEIQSLAVHPLHVAVYDIKRDRPVEVYPFPEDPERREFSGLIAPHISPEWCMQHNAACDPQNFDTDLTGPAAVNESARVFGFEAKFDARGFGDAAEKQVAPRTVVYVFRERGGAWEHREFPSAQLRALFGVASLQELVGKQAKNAFTKAGQ